MFKPHLSLRSGVVDDGGGEGEEDKKPPATSCSARFKKLMDIWAVAGVHYISDPSIPGGWVTRFFWVLFFFVSLGSATYLSINAFFDWQKNPILTSVSTAGYPIENLTFPAITICGMGMIQSAVTDAIVRQVCIRQKVTCKQEKGKRRELL